MVPRAEQVYKGVVTDPARFAAQARELLAEVRVGGPPEALVVALRAHAWAERLAMHGDTAKTLLDEAVRVAARHRLDHRLGEVLVSRVAVQHELGRTSDARRDAARAAILLRPAERAEVVFQQAVLLQNAGSPDAAAALYRQVLADTAASVVVRAKAGNNLGHLEGERGRTRRATVLLDDAEALDAGPVLAAALAQTRAWVLVRSGRVGESLAQFDTARHRYTAAGLPLGELALDHATALADLRLVPEALGLAAEAVRNLGAAPLMAAEAHLLLARLHLLAEDDGSAGVAAARAAELLNRQHRPGWAHQARVVEHQARGTLTPGQRHDLRVRAAELERLGLRSDAVAARLLAGGPADLAAARRLARGGPVLLRLRGHLAAARAAPDTPAALAACRRGLTDLERHRDALPTVELRARAAAHGAELGERGLRALLHSGARPAPVLRWAERTRAAALAAAGAAGPVPSLTGLRDALGPAVLLELVVLDGRLLALVLDGRAARQVDLGPLHRVVAALEPTLFALRRLARPDAPAAVARSAARTLRTGLAGLGELVLRPAGVRTGRALVVVPVGVLHRVPWSALHDGPVTVAPSARTWLRTSRSTSTGGHVALVAAPALPGAAAEVAALHEVHPGARVLTGTGSTCAAAVAVLDGAELAHLACHGSLRSDNPAFSALLLADGPLSVHELSLQARPPRRVVLAACDSGVQVGLPGDEALGLVTALLARGTAAVVASGVPVPDGATTRLVRALHAELAAGARAAAALWAARRGLDLDDPAQLVTWCAFDAHGAG